MAKSKNTTIQLCARELYRQWKVAVARRHVAVLEAADDDRAVDRAMNNFEPQIRAIECQTLDIDPKSLDDLAAVVHMIAGICKDHETPLPENAQALLDRLPKHIYDLERQLSERRAA